MNPRKCWMQGRHQKGCMPKDTEEKPKEKSRGPVNATASVYRQAMGSQGERRKQSGELRVKVPLLPIEFTSSKYLNKSQLG